MSLFLLLTSIFFSFTEKEIQSEVLYASVNITNKAGFEINGTALTFGNIQRPGTSSRNVILTNDYNFPVIIFIKVEGDISKVLDFPEEIKLGIGEKERVSFSVIASPNVDYGFYSGEVLFNTFRD
ncbi:MAG: hypothetical protein Q7S27_02385 [Nanoarchaeota archaeon]|nr:hypothetical protein [Nanoarchaeota archaeon]